MVVALKLLLAVFSAGCRVVSPWLLGGVRTIEGVGEGFESGEKATAEI